ncbi:MAG: transporter [Myxococcales bacterium FL481]|nr:MAG: transporter [Myxococcales bacterium FL481]
MEHLDGQTLVLDPAALFFHASGPVLAVLWLLLAASAAVWWIFVVKSRQLRRWRVAQSRLEQAIGQRRLEPQQLASLARHHQSALGAPVLEAVATRRGQPEVVSAVVARLLVEQRERATSMLTWLASIGATAPFVGLLGTVYGIMDAFFRIGREKSASLPVVAPAIGEALLATAVGLFAAIPAVLAYNLLSARAEALMDRMTAAAREWAASVTREDD